MRDLLSKLDALNSVNSVENIGQRSDKNLGVAQNENKEIKNLEELDDKTLKSYLDKATTVKDIWGNPNKSYLNRIQGLGRASERLNKKNQSKDEPDEKYLDKVIRDLHKDVYGFRPDHEFAEEWMASDYENKLRIYNNMLKGLHDDVEDPRKNKGVAEGDYPDGSSIKTPDVDEWKQQYQQAVMAVKNAKTKQEYEAASDRAGRIKDLLASKGIKVGPALGQQDVEEGSDWRDYDYDNDREDIPSNATFVNLKPKLYVHYENGESQALTRHDQRLINEIIGESDYNRFFLDSDMEIYLKEEHNWSDEDIDQFQAEFSVQQNLQKGYWEARLANKLMSKTEDIFQIGDEFGISLSEDFEIAASIIGIADKAVIISLDETAIQYLSDNGFFFEELSEAKANANFDAEDIMKLQTLDNVESMKEKALELISKPSRRPMKPEKVEWFKNALSRMTGKDQVIKLMYDLLLSGEGFGVIGSRSSMRPSGYRQRFNDSIANEAEYQGREVPLGKPMAGDVKKSKVYVKNPKGNVVKVNFGDKTMRIKKSNPARRKSFRARHNCANPGPRHKARYWSCRSW